MRLTLKQVNEKYGLTIPRVRYWTLCGKLKSERITSTRKHLTVTVDEDALRAVLKKKYPPKLIGAMYN